MGRLDATAGNRLGFARSVALGAENFNLDELLPCPHAGDANGIEKPPCTIARPAEYGLDRYDVANSLAFGAVHHVTTRESVV
jgi:hypothetical protein